jgi:uncharacterized repeat protein (TIGR02543 family)
MTKAMRRWQLYVLLSTLCLVCFSCANPSSNLKTVTDTTSGVTVVGAFDKDVQICYQDLSSDKTVLSSVQTTLDGKYDTSKSLVVFDLHLTSSGVAYTPSGSVVVTMKTPTGVTEDTLLFHIKVAGTFEKLAFVLGDGTMVFTVSSFSTFVLCSAPAQIINLPWFSNATHHWHLVNNSAETDKAEHTFSAVEVVTENEKPYDKRTCTVCAYVDKKEHVVASNTYSIIYKANGATGGEVPSAQTDIPSGNTGTISDNTGDLVKEGYTFDGWNTQSDGKGSTYKVGATPHLGSNLVLYAKWKKQYVSSGVYFLMRGRRTVNEKPWQVSYLQKGDEELFSWWDTNAYANYFKDSGVAMTNSDVYVWGTHMYPSAMPGYSKSNTFLKKNDADPSDYGQMDICGIAAKGNDFYLVGINSSDYKIILQKNGTQISSCAGAETATFAQEIAFSGDKVIVAYSTYSSSTEKNTLHIVCYDEGTGKWQEFTNEIACISTYTDLHICVSAGYVYVSGSFNKTESSGATTPSVLKVSISDGNMTTLKSFGNQYDSILGIVASETDMYILQTYRESETTKVRVWKNDSELYKVYEDAKPSFKNGQIQAIGTDLYIGLLLNDTVNEKNIYQVLKNDSKLMTIDVPDDYYLENFYVRP